MGRMRESLQMAPPEIADCLKSTVGEDVLNKLQSGNFAPPRELGEQMRSCFEKMGPPRRDFGHEGEEFQNGKMPPPSGMTPPPGFMPPDYHPEGVMPPEGYLKPPEEFIPQEGETYPYQQYEQQYQQQYQQQYEQMMPPQDMQQMPLLPSLINKQNPFAQIIYFFTGLLLRQ